MMLPQCQSQRSRLFFLLLWVVHVQLEKGFGDGGSQVRGNMHTLFFGGEGGGGGRVLALGFDIYMYIGPRSLAQIIKGAEVEWAEGGGERGEVGGDRKVTPRLR